MIRWMCVILVVLIALVCAAELAWHRTPMELIRGRSGDAGGDNVTVIRLGIASWQMSMFPWEETIRRYEAAHGGRVRVVCETVPEDAKNSILLSWRVGRTEFDAIVAWADEEIFPFVDYNVSAADPEQRSLIMDVRTVLSPEQIAGIIPAMLAGCSRGEAGSERSYEVPWMGEVLALNVNWDYLQAAGVTRVPRTWDEVEDACRKVQSHRPEVAEAYSRLFDPEHKQTVPEIAPIGLNFAQTGFFAQNCYVPLLAAYKKGRGILDDRGHLDVSSPEAVRAIETLKRLKDAGYVTHHAMISEDCEKDLVMGLVAMYPHFQGRGFDAVAKIGRNAIRIEPSPGSAEAGSLVATYGAIIPKCSPVAREAVRACYEMFATDAYGFQTGVALGVKDSKGQHVIGSGGKMPVQRAMYQRSDMPAGILSMAPALEKGYGPPDPLNWGQVAIILAVEFQKYLQGDHATAEETLARVRKRLDAEVYSLPAQ